MSVARLRRSGSGLLFHARYADALVDAITGQPHTFTRASTADFTDSNGNVGTAGQFQPRFEVTEGVPALLVEESADAGAVETLSYDWPIVPGRPFGALVTFLVPSTPTARQMNIGDTNPQLIVRLHGPGDDEFRVIHIDAGGSSVSSITSGLDASPGSVIEGLVRFRADGSIEIEASKDGASPVIAEPSATLDPEAAWSAPRLYAGHPTDGTALRTEVREIKIHPDPDLTMDELRGA